ncbi:hypothetical protein LQ327_05435 [Actinomycetospora endophytica]|uniref:Uncharacterized protein n=1 Tax=Actinomycetospora endophytica TaxID=2291215 RepID=A0ABS8P5K8_9PSEU|nr:hypothetical protein [Actinomycetospora endophytica]MCD2192830.1 hypothetical protein [Actinomycetospora endophytica]
MLEPVVEAARRAEVRPDGDSSVQPVEGVVEVGADRGAGAAGEPAAAVPGADVTVQGSSRVSAARVGEGVGRVVLGRPGAGRGEGGTGPAHEVGLEPDVVGGIERVDRRRGGDQLHDLSPMQPAVGLVIRSSDGEDLVEGAVGVVEDHPPHRVLAMPGDLAGGAGADRAPAGDLTRTPVAAEQRGEPQTNRDSRSEGQRLSA